LNYDDSQYSQELLFEFLSAIFSKLERIHESTTNRIFIQNLLTLICENLRDLIIEDQMTRTESMREIYHEE